MRHKVVSACTAGVLSILLIFTSFFSFGLRGAAGFDSRLMYTPLQNSSGVCRTGDSLSGLAYPNTRLLPGVNCEASDENKLFYICVFSAALIGSVMCVLKALCQSAISDRHTKYLVRLLI